MSITIKNRFKYSFFLLLFLIAAVHPAFSQRDKQKDIYISRIVSMDSISVWYVNGSYIRKNIDIEFTNFGQHYDFNFIPLNEFWIDNEHSPGESKYFIKHMSETFNLMKNGMDYDSALVIGDSVQKIERMKSSLFKKSAALLSAGDTINLIKMIHRKPYAEQQKNLKIWIVNGEIIRDLFFIDFTEGGHDKVYNFVPKGEVWIDDDLEPGEIRFVLLHELYERYLMSVGSEYGPAHEKASALELKYRRNPNGINNDLHKYLKFNN